MLELLRLMRICKHLNRKRSKDALENLPGHEKFLHKFLIPANEKSNLLEFLKLMGIRRWNLFPDLQTLAEGLKNEEFC
jgi:hypothetical protein